MRAHEVPTPHICSSNTHLIKQRYEKSPVKENYQRKLDSKKLLSNFRTKPQIHVLREAKLNDS